MSVPLTLLGLLEREPSHGYDLTRDLRQFLRAREAAAVLFRCTPRSDGWHATVKVIAGDAEPGDGPDRKRYAITDRAGHEVDDWLAEPVEPEPHLQTWLFAKVTLALMLGKPAEAYLDSQRAAHMQRMQELTDLKRTRPARRRAARRSCPLSPGGGPPMIDLTSVRLKELAEAVRN